MEGMGAQDHQRPDQGRMQRGGSFGSRYTVVVRNTPAKSAMAFTGMAVINPVVGI